MTLKEAIESGKRFRRSSWGSDSGYVRVDGSIIIVDDTGNRMAIDVARITATDWEIESIPEKTATLTRAQLLLALQQATIATEGGRATILHEMLLRSVGLEKESV